MEACSRDGGSAGDQAQKDRGSHTSIASIALLASCGGRRSCKAARVTSKLYVACHALHVVEREGEMKNDNEVLG